MLETASNVIQASLNPESGEIKVLPSTPKPAEAPAPEAVPDQIAAKAPEPTAPVEEKKPDQFSKGFAAMAKKDKELRARNAQIRQKEIQIQEKEAQFARFEQLKAQNPAEAIKTLGISYEDVTNSLLNGGTPSTEVEIKNIKQQMAEYIQKQEAEKQALVQKQQQAQVAQTQQVLSTFKTEVAEFVKANPEAYKLTNVEGEEAYKLIADTVENVFYATKKIISKEEAAKTVEEYLKKDAEAKWAAMGFKTEPSKSATASTPQAKAQVAMERAANTLSGPRPTLNNTMTSSTTPSLTSPRIESDRMARAIAALSK